MKTPLVLLAALTLATGRLFAEDAAHSAPVAVPAGVAKNVSPDEAEKLLKDNPKVVVLDVRTPEEFAKGHIAGAKNVDFKAADFAEKVSALDKGKTYLVHCGSGRRSTKSLEVFQAQNISSILHLNEGFKAWEAAGKPVEK